MNYSAYSNIRLLIIASFGIMTILSCSEKKTNSVVHSEEEQSLIPDNSRDHEGDTFSVVAYDPNTQEIGGAGCSCYGGNINFLNEIIFSPGGTLLGAIHTQAAYTSCNQDRARNRMLAGDTPAQIVSYMQANDCNSNNTTRQYGIVGIDGGGNITTAGFTGTSNGNWAGNITGIDPNTGIHYAIQGNILDTSTAGGGRDDILNDMETAFRNTTGTLADKLMAALQGAKRVGGDNRCTNSGNSGRASFVRVQKPTDPIGSPSINLWEYPNVNYVEPIDVLQCSYDTFVSTPFCRQTVNTFPYAMDFETKSWEKEETCNIRNARIRSRFASPSNNTGPSGANQGQLYAFVESSDLGPDNFSNRVVMGSPCFEIPFNHTATFSFDYHMYGSNMGTLNVTANDGTGWVTLWSLSGNQGNSWTNDATIDLTQYHGKSVKLRFDATTGNGALSDMAIDDVKITVTPGISCNSSTTFSSGTWSNGAPKIRTSAIINDDYDTSTFGNLVACEITINSGNTLTVDNSDYILSANNIVVDGTLNVVNEGSVVQVDGAASVTNNGTINVEVTTPFLKPKDFMIMGSPMTAETRAGVFGGAYIVRDHHTSNFVPNGNVASAFPLAENFADDNGNNWLTYSGGITPAEGFMVFPQASSNNGNTTYDLTYTQGTLNNGDHTFTALYNGTQNASPNVLANPYASSIFADDFIKANSNVDAVYFWEHVTPPSAGIPGYNAMNFTMEDISMYNLTGGTAATTGGTTPNGYIATGQGFGIKASAGGAVSFTNAMRRVDNNTTLRTQNERDRLWLSVRNEQYQMQGNTLLGFLEEASSGVDTGYDSKRLATVVSLYSHLASGDLEFGIQARESFDPEMTIPMGFSSLIEAELTYRISIEQLEGINLSNATVYLVDHYENTITNLNEEAYDFVSYGGTYNNRFTIQFETEILGTNDAVLDSVVIYPNPTKDLLTISSPNISIQAIRVYDISGRKVSENSFSATNVYQVNLSDLDSAIYLVEITTENGTTAKQVVKE